MVWAIFAGICGTRQWFLPEKVAPPLWYEHYFRESRTIPTSMSCQNGMHLGGSSPLSHLPQWVRRILDDYGVPLWCLYGRNGVQCRFFLTFFRCSGTLYCNNFSTIKTTTIHNLSLKKHTITHYSTLLQLISIQCNPYPY